LTIESDVQDLKEDLHQLKDHMQRSEDRLAILPFIQARIDTLPSFFESSIMLQLGSSSREQQQFQLTRPGTTEILGRVDALVRAH
jgi:hypothetical protein